jgi:hypothetical protein
MGPGLLTVEEGDRQVRKAFSGYPLRSGMASVGAVIDRDSRCLNGMGRGQ